MGKNEFPVISWQNEKKNQKNLLDRFREKLLTDGRTDGQTTKVSQEFRPRHGSYISISPI